MENIILVLIALSILGFGLISGRAQKSILTPPMAFVLFGLLASPHFVGRPGFHIDNRGIHAVAELALILVLFIDAARIDLHRLVREHNLPTRLLLIALPLTMICGALAAALLFDHFKFWELAVLAAILAPTDPALSQAVVLNQQVPVRIRQTINVESGLNDGLALPAVLVLMSIAGAAGHNESAGQWLRFGMLQVTLGPLAGIAVGYGGGKAVEAAGRSMWMNHTFQDLSALGLALLAYGTAELLGGNGFIAAFCAGLTLGNTSRAICQCLYDFGEDQGQLLNLLIFMIFGAIMVPPALDRLTLPVLLYALLSLTVVRLVPVALSLMGAGLNKGTVLFVSWFGPRGLASILFALLVMEDSALAGRHQILEVVVITVLLSVFLHGITAYPVSNWYADQSSSYAPDQEEHVKVSEMPTRLPAENKKHIFPS